MPGEGSGRVFGIDALAARRRQTGKSYLEFLRVPALSAGLYVLAPGAIDGQKPHAEDEIYYVLRGQARMRVAGEELEVSPGQVIFVPARVEHRFFDVREELALLVVFAPPESL